MTADHDTAGAHSSDPAINDGKGCIQGTVITHVQLCLKLKYRGAERR